MTAAAIRLRLAETLTLIADMERLGLTVTKVETTPGQHATPDWISADIRLDLETWNATGEDCERTAAVLLDAYRDATVDRLGEGSFAVVCPGRPSWSAYFSRSVCEKVQVGTRKSLVPAPGAPMVEVEEPVYEWRCADPTVAANLAVMI